MQRSSTRLPAALSLVLGAAALAWPAEERETPWEEILGPSQAQLPEPLDEIEWRTSLKSAIKQAEREDRPLFVVMRCPPCKQCSGFDQLVLEGGPELDPLLAHFVTVRLTSMADADLRLFPVEDFQDLDLSWWGWFLSPDLRVYGVYGGRDEVSDETRISVPSLAATLERVLEHHYDPRRAGWDLDGPPAPRKGRAETPERLSGFKSWRKQSPEYDKSCMHCHQVAEILRQPALDDGTFDKVRDLEIWPFPENVGLVLERDHGLRVAEVRPGSPAAEAGLQSGDVLGAAGGRRLFGQTDLRAFLHRGPRGEGSIELVGLRDGQVMSAELALEDGWRSTALEWRMSVSQGNVGTPPGFWPNRADGRRAALGIPQGEMAIAPWFGKKPGSAAWKAGLRPEHVITAVDDERRDLSGRTFMVWFRQHYDVGDEVTFEVRTPDGGRSEIEVTLQRPK